MKPWRLLNREKIVSTPWIQIYRDTVQTGKGVMIEEYYTINQRNTAMVLPITRKHQTILVCEYRYGCGDYVWQLPAGKIDDNETALEAGKRELLEETGYQAESWKLLADWYISSPRMPNRQFIFVARDAHKVREFALSEETILKVVSWQEAIEMVLAGEIKDPHSCAAILWMDKL
jgi:8-oxo-dGTP pyrophosphatase MutT (NUDIX family)